MTGNPAQRPEGIVCRTCRRLVNAWTWGAGVMQWYWGDDWREDPIHPQDPEGFVCSDACWDDRARRVQ